MFRWSDARDTLVEEKAGARINPSLDKVPTVVCTWCKFTSYLVLEVRVAGCENIKDYWESKGNFGHGYMVRGRR